MAQAARPPAPRRLRLATRGSELARWQAEHVAALVRAAVPSVEAELVVVDTRGDRTQAAEVPLWEIGGKGVFVKEVQAAVLDGRADLAVHSAKDLPAVTPDELVLAAVPERADPRDALVGATLADLPAGATVATGSVRRRAQLAWRRPDLTFAGLRGNIATRIDKAAGFGAVVVAAAALERLGRIDDAAELLDASIVLPQVGQGAIAVECRVDDEAARSTLAAADHGPSRAAVEAERGFLAALGGDCDLPAGAHATPLDPDEPGAGLRVEGVLCSLDGHVLLRHAVEAPDAADGPAAGAEVARHLLAHGGEALLTTR